MDGAGEDLNRAQRPCPCSKLKECSAVERFIRGSWSDAALTFVFVRTPAGASSSSWFYYLLHSCFNGGDIVHLSISKCGYVVPWIWLHWLSLFRKDIWKGIQTKVSWLKNQALRLRISFSATNSSHLFHHPLSAASYMTCHWSPSCSTQISRTTEEIPPILHIKIQGTSQSPWRRWRFSSEAVLETPQ